MGIVRFNGLFVAERESRKPESDATCAAFFADYNQEMYNVFGLLKLSCTPMDKVVEGKPCKNYKFNKDTPDPFALFKEISESYINMRISKLKKLEKLEEIYIAMDGTPCYGKIYQQFRRRTDPVRYYLNDKVIFSEAMTIPGTKLTEIFSECLVRLYTGFKDEMASKRKISLTFSLCDIPGEGEHKILTMVRKSIYVNYSENRERKSVLILSNDSDSIMSILHQNLSSVYVETQVWKNKQPEPKIIKVSDVREYMSANKNETLNIPLLIAFAGNDFLPEMLDTLELREFYERAKANCNFPLTKNIVDADGNEVVVIDYVNFEKFLFNMKNNEIDMYFNKTKTDLSPESNPRFREAQFKDKIPMTDTERLNFKRRYYNRIYQNYRRHVLGHIPPDDSDDFPVDDKILADFEEEVAVSYLKTYVWYFYYQSGFAVKSPLDNSFYPYGYPPLYNSLYIIFLKKKKENLIKFSHDVNPELIPRERTIEYFEKLPRFDQLHHFMVLQQKDLECIYDKVPFDDSATRFKKERSIFNDKEIQTRWSENFIELYMRVDIDKLLDKYSDFSIVDLNRKTKVIGEVKKSEKRGAYCDKYAIAGEIQFGEISTKK